MSLREVINADVAGVFLNTDDFAVSITYTPQSGNGSQRTIKAIVDEAMEQDIAIDGTIQKMNTRRISISAVDNTNGHQTPKRVGLDGAGDVITGLGDSKSWYVREIEQEGFYSKTGMHVLLCTDTRKVR